MPKNDKNIAMDMEIQSVASAPEPGAKAPRERIADILFTKPQAHAAYLAGLADFAARGGVVSRAESDGTRTYWHPVTNRRIPAESVSNVGGFARAKPDLILTTESWRAGRTDYDTASQLGLPV